MRSIRARRGLGVEQEAVEVERKGGRRRNQREVAPVPQVDKPDRQLHDEV